MFCLWLYCVSCIYTSPSAILIILVAVVLKKNFHMSISNFIVQSVVSDCLQPYGLQARLPCPSSPRACLNSCPLSWWCHLSYPLSPPSPPTLNLPNIRVFPMSQFFASGGQSIGTSASVSFLPMAIQGWSPCCQGTLNTTVWKHQFFGAQPSLWSNSHVHRWLQESHSFDYTDLCWQSDVSTFQYTV